MSRNLDDHPFTIDTVVQFTRAAWLDGERIAATMEPTDFDDPFMVVESIGWSGRAHYMEVTASNGETYTVYDMAAFDATSFTGERGLIHAIAQHKQANR